MEYRFYTTFPVEIGGVIIGTLEDVECIAEIETDDSDWFLTGYKVIGTKGVDFGFLGGKCEPVKGEITLDPRREQDQQKEQLRRHVERAFREPCHAIDIERMIRAEQGEDEADYRYDDLVSAELR